MGWWRRMGIGCCCGGGLGVEAGLGSWVGLFSPEGRGDVPLPIALTCGRMPACSNCPRPRMLCP